MGKVEMVKHKVDFDRIQIGDIVVRGDDIVLVIGTGRTILHQHSYIKVRDKDDSHMKLYEDNWWYDGGKKFVVFKAKEIK